MRDNIKKHKNQKSDMVKIRCIEEEKHFKEKILGEEIPLNLKI